MTTIQILLVILTAAVCTFATRLVPFALFAGKKEPPEFVRYLGSVLPFAVIAILVVYCLKGVSFGTISGFLPELISVAVVAALHLWKRSNLLSIGVGTVLYMILVQYVFVK